MTASKVLVPKNLYWPELRNIEVRPLDTHLAPSSPQISLQGEAYLAIAENLLGYSFSTIYPSANMYGDTTNTFQYTGTEKLDFIDRCLVKLNFSSFGSLGKTMVDGDDVNTNITGNFYALSDGDYYFDSTWAAKSITNTNVPINSYAYFENLGQPTSIAGKTILDYEGLQTKGVTVGYQPSVQKSAVIKLGGDIIPDLNNRSTSTVFKNGTLNPLNPGGDIIAGSGVKYSANVTNDYINTYSSFTNNSYAGAISIANVKLNLNDNRYGEINAFHNYQYTGASYTFDSSEITTLQNGGTVTVTNLEVWGGDCFVGPQVFKVCDSTYSVVNQQNNFVGSDTKEVDAKKWYSIFLATGLNRAITMPIAVENAGQYITVILESEYNGEVRDLDVLTETTTIVNGIPVLNNKTKDTIRTPLTYKYNINLSQQNSQKVFESKLQHSFTQTDFNSRVPYSDIKIYNSDQAGFDVWKVADYVDLPEQRYAITKLAVAADQLYAIQEKGVVYLPVGNRQIEETDAATLAVRTGDVIGRPVVVDSQRGSQHLRSIIETGDRIYVPDNRNADIYVLTGTILESITENNETIFRNLLNTTLPSNALRGYFDFFYNQYWLTIDGDTSHIYNQDRKLWIGDYEFTPFSAVYQENTFTTDKEGSSLSVYSLTNTTLPVILSGVEVTPRVTICINPDADLSKTFDVLMLAASDRLLEGDILIENESGNQTVTGIDFDIPSIEGNFRIPIPRIDSDSISRARGLRALLTIKWNDLRSYLQSVYTKYDLSKRIPF